MEYTYPNINLRLSSLKDFQEQELAKAVLNHINSYGEGFMPHKYDLYEPLKRRYDSSCIEDVASLWMNYEVNDRYTQNNEKIAAGQVLMQRTKGHYLNCSIFWEKSSEETFNFISYTIGIDFLKKDDNYSKFMELCKKLIDTIEPVYGDITNENFLGHTQALELKLRLPDIHWGLILGKPYIEMFTKEKILSCPCNKITELNSSVLIETTDNVYKEISNEVREKIKYHLGENAFVWGGKRALRYKDNSDNLVPEFDFSNVIIL
jgi:hypothetical protein